MPWFSFLRRRSSVQKPSAQAAENPYVVAGGRRYMADTPYALPKDIGETNRLNFQHFLLRQLLRGNYLAPLKNPQDILDVGCGTGRWSLEMAVQFPRANVFGLDKVAPAANTLTLGYGITQQPHNYVFVEGDVLQGLPFPDVSFDFTHMRFLYSAIPATRWPFVISEIARVTRPGGWVEFIEGGLPPPGGPAMNMMHSLTINGGNKIGLDMSVGSRLGTYLREAGLANVQFKEIPVPVGAHGGRIGKLLALDLQEVFKAGRGLSIARGLSTAEEYDQALQTWPQEVDQYRATFSFYAAIGQRTK